MSTTKVILTENTQNSMACESLEATHAMRTLLALFIDHAKWSRVPKLPPEGVEHIASTWTGSGVETEVYASSGAEEERRGLAFLYCVTAGETYAFVPNRKLGL